MTPEALPPAGTPRIRRIPKRQSLFSRDRTERIINAIRLGSPFELACKVGGISLATFNVWRRDSRRKCPWFVDDGTRADLKNAPWKDPRFVQVHPDGTLPPELMRAMAQAGLSPEQIAAVAGCLRPPQDDFKIPTFGDVVEWADGERCARWLQFVEAAAAKGIWTAAAFKLERTYPRHFGRRDDSRVNELQAQIQNALLAVVNGMRREGIETEVIQRIVADLRLVAERATDTDS